MARAFIFPGRGGETIGMGLHYVQAYPSARYVFQEIDDALGQELSRLIFEGPEETLALPENADPAMLAVSLAGVKALEEQGDLWLSQTGSFVAGHGRGEATALAAVDALSAGAAAKWLRARAKAVWSAFSPEKGAVCTVHGLDLATVESLAREAATQGKGICELARDDAPDSHAVSGERAAVEAFLQLAAKKGGETHLLDGIPPLHSSLMEPAVAELQATLAEVEVRAPKLPLVSNVTAYALESADEIRTRLAEQVARPIRWRESVEYMKDHGVTEFLEIGHGDDLSTYVRAIDGKHEAHAIEDAQDIERALDDVL
ncbi:ACP S-malonyltransferase [Rhodovibrio salinarum]|uniref:Malonyl CoA-acyl carrier protein transacylase n=1 Tax=Rhodovibrio salinarum TaxID=1087 RepID=A0A934QK19_9PROT|nr:ACP S-malonyltransferase [Rhodovibrio salinarum]MBK1698313.1 ACP S-malonyltransferase [Rhodovibrio salinarum]